MATVIQLRRRTPPTAAERKLADRLIAASEALTADLLAGRLTPAIYEKRLHARLVAEQRAEAKHPIVRTLLADHFTSRYFELVEESHGR